MRSRWATAFAGCGLAFAIATSAAAQVEVPPNDGWVTDLADLLSPAEERELESLMESYRAGTTHEIALLTVPTTGRQTIERYALEVARAWRLGVIDENNGALLVVARDDRKIRIEVGRGLEGQLTDSIAGRIIRNVIAPAFKRGDFPAGLRAGVEAMHAAIGGEYAKIPATPARDGGGSGGMLVLLIALVVMMWFAGRRGRRDRNGRRFAGGGWWPWLLPTGGGRGHGGGFGGGGFGGGGFGGFGGGGGFSGGGASGGW